VLGSVGVTAGGGSDGPQPGGDQSYQDHQAGSSVKDQELKKGKHPEQAKKTDEKVSQSKREGESPSSLFPFHPLIAFHVTRELLAHCPGPVDSELIEKNGRLLQDTLGFVADISEGTSILSPCLNRTRAFQLRN
jgi:hypothetical protein